MSDEIIARYSKRVGYSEKEEKALYDQGHRIRHIHKMSEATRHYSIRVIITKSEHCNSGHTEGQELTMDVDGNFITQLCPKKICVYLASQLTIPVALINERFSEGIDPNDFHFMRYVRCPDAGVQCLGYGEVMARVTVVPRS